MILQLLVCNNIPSLRSRYVTYGSRATPVDNPGTKEHGVVTDRNVSKEPASSLVGSFLDHLATYQVPHTYFTHFYIASVLASLFWASQLLSRGPAIRTASSYASSGRPGRSMTVEQVYLAWTLMAAQGTRRLYESITLAKPTSSTMWFVHWCLGIGFYLAMGIAVWIEGLPAIISSRSILSFSAPSIRTLLCLAIFILASGVQHDCHNYLASLKKYTFPTHPAFQQVLCPHYLAECLIYVALTFIAAPKGAMINKTIFTGLMFVSVNLGITAETSREWYTRKFGEKEVSGKWRMVPYVY